MTRTDGVGRAAAGGGPPRTVRGGVLVPSRAAPACAECHKTCKPETVTWRHGDHIPWLSRVQFYDPTGGRIRTLLLGGNLP